MNDVTVNELIALGFKNAYSAFHDDRFIYNLHKDGLCIQWDSIFDDEINISGGKEETGVAIPIKGIDHIKRIIEALFNSEPNDAVSDTTGDDSSNEDGKKENK